MGSLYHLSYSVDALIDIALSTRQVNSQSYIDINIGFVAWCIWYNQDNINLVLSIIKVSVVDNLWQLYVFLIDDKNTTRFDTIKWDFVD